MIISKYLLDSIATLDEQENPILLKVLDISNNIERCLNSSWKWGVKNGPGQSEFQILTYFAANKEMLLAVSKFICNVVETNEPRLRVLELLVCDQDSGNKRVFNLFATVHEIERAYEAEIRFIANNRFFVCPLC